MVKKRIKPVKTRKLCMFYFFCFCPGSFTLMSHSRVGCPQSRLKEGKSDSTKMQTCLTYRAPLRASTDPGKKQFKCKYLNCNKVYAFQANCYRHERSHRDPRAHVCVICDRGFYRKDELARHLEAHKRKLARVEKRTTVMHTH